MPTSQILNAMIYPMFSRPIWRSFLFWLLVIAGIVITSPYANFQTFLSQGDHGRDLYAAQAVYRGELPYRDFWWVYGPLTPYYYGLFFKIFGVKITSMILGKILLQILGAVLMYVAMAPLVTEIPAFICGCWFLLFQQDFFFTYNHLAGLVVIIAIIGCLLAYIKDGAVSALWKALSLIFVLCLIKVNFGIAALVAALMATAARDFVFRTPVDAKKKLYYLLGLIVLPLLVFLVYWLLLHGLSEMEIRQCLPYKEGDQPYTVNPLTAIHQFLHMTLMRIKSSWMNLVWALIINAGGLRCFYLIFKNKLPVSRRVFLLSLGMLCLFYVFNSHEYLKSGVWYRDYWSQPVDMMIIFLLIGVALRSIPRWLCKTIYTFIAIMAGYSWFLMFRSVNAAKMESQWLSLPRAQVYLGNSPSWINTVTQTTEYLNKTLSRRELFFALPYDCLYYYLTDKKTPTRQLIFFEHIKIPMQQERSVIAELERNHVNYCLVSSRAFAHQELGLGLLGTTYCPLIGKYIQDNFQPMARFGDWTNEPGWAWNHGTLILKRKIPL